MFDMKKIEEEARNELAAEKASTAKTKIKSHLAKIAAAETVVRNLKEEYQVLLRDIGV